MFQDTNPIFIEDLFTPVNDIFAMKWNKQVESERRFKFVGKKKNQDLDERKNKTVFIC
jgi:hypothetical protein